MEGKLKRNDPCHCGSGRKYKHCHLPQEQQASPPSNTPAPAAKAEFPPPEGDAPTSVENNITADQESGKAAWWDDFDRAEVDGKIDLFLNLLREGALTEQDPFEMLGEIRDELAPHHHPEHRTRYAELVQQLHETAPEVYQVHAPYYQNHLIRDAISDERWADLHELLTAFAEEMDKGIDFFFEILEALMYHGRSQILIDIMYSAQARVAESDELMPWVADEFNNELIDLILFDYVETTDSPRFYDPALQERLSSFEGLNIEVAQRAFDSLSAAGPADWKSADFGEAVDAEQWETNLGKLALDFMVDRRHAGVPLSRSEMARQLLFALLIKQFRSRGYITPTRAATGRSRRGGNRRQRQAAKAPEAVPSLSGLIPTHNGLDRALAEVASFISPHPYKIAAAMELLPAYLHFLARLGVISSTDMDKGLRRLNPLMDGVLRILDSSECDARGMEAVKRAWSEETIAAMQADVGRTSQQEEVPEKSDVRQSRPPEQRPPDTIQTYTFLVTYERETGAWRKIEISGEQSLHQLHRSILKAVDFDDDHLYSFYMSGQAWDNTTEYTSPRGDGPSANQVFVGDLPLRMKQTFLYLFDYGDEHRFSVKLVEVNPDAPKDAQYPRIVETRGANPEQYKSWEGEEDWEDE